MTEQSASYVTEWMICPTRETGSDSTEPKGALEPPPSARRGSNATAGFSRQTNTKAKDDSFVFISSSWPPSEHGRGPL